MAAQRPVKTIPEMSETTDIQDNDLLFGYTDALGLEQKFTPSTMAEAVSKRGGIKSIDSMEDFAGFEGIADQQVSLKGYHPNTDVGGGIFYWDANLARTNHNGGTIISPARDLATEGLSTFLTTTTDTDLGCWVRKHQGFLSSYSFGMRSGISYDNTAAWAKLLQSSENGWTIDLEGGEFRIFDGVTGIVSSTATPGVDEAISEDRLPILKGKRDIQIKNGAVYVADQKTAASKSYFPCTLSLEECDNITLNNLVLESKGESYGDADASAGLSKDDRMRFIPFNGGNALSIARCRNITISNSIFRLCGSVGVVYVSSSTGIKINGCHTVAASLGYAGYAVDAWVGQTDVTGFKRHDCEITDSTSYAESLTARDTLSAVGSSTYGSKGCLVAEDSSVFVFVHGGYYADAYPNGSARDIGNAFTANACEVIVSGAYVDNCASVGATNQSADVAGKLTVSNVIAKNIRKTLHQVLSTSFNNQYFQYDNCDVEINNSGVWPGDGNRAREYSSVVANMKSGTSVFGSISECRILGPQTVWVNDEACYGYLRISNSYIETDGWLALSDGWGGSSGEYTSGVRIFNSDIRDLSSETGAYLQYTNFSSSSVFTHIGLDFSSSTLTTSTVRLAYSISINGSDLVRTLKGFDKLYNAWSDTPYMETGTYPVVYKEQRGLSGSNRKVVFEYPNRVAFRPDLIKDGDTGGPLDMVYAISAVGSAVVNADGNVEREWFIPDSGLTLWSAGTRITASYISSYPTVS